MTAKDALREIIQDQLGRHAGFRIQDLYKLLHQAAFGGGHLLADRSQVLARIREEWQVMERIPKGETLLEIIDPAGEIMRVNLRLYKKTGGTPEEMADLFIQSAKMVQPDRKKLVQTWEAVTEMAKSDQIRLSVDEMEDFWIEMGRKDFPPAHHSDSYIEVNRPAYRIVLKKMWKGFRDTEEQTASPTM